MRALGPGSVSSFLKIILDVVYVALAISVVLIGLGILASLLFDLDPALFSSMIRASGRGAPSGLEIAGGLFVTALYAGGILGIVGELRRIFATLTAGDPFHPGNVRRLRVIGLVLAALGILEVIRWPMGLIDANLAARTACGQASVPNVTTWFAVLVVFVLAEVFREGARLRREAELTI
jgi:hypothetical protein